MSAVKTKLVAIAKDEALYLPEWIAHHLFVGFDEIEIHVNRTTDNTLEILNNICEKYSQVSYQSMDWIDICSDLVSKNIQFVSQALAIEQARIDGQCSHICFLDIDEFWFDLEACQKINDYITELGQGNIIYNLWVNDLPDENPFSHIRNHLSGNLSVLGKCIYPLTTDFSYLHLHKSDVVGDQSWILPNGDEVIFDENANQAVVEEQRKLNRAVIFHRATRSEMEYVSLLFRGRPSDSFPYKRNRKGIPVRYEHTVDLALDETFCEQRTTILNEVLDACGSSALENAKNFVTERYRLSVEHIELFIQDRYDVMYEMFKGVRIYETVLPFINYRQQRLKECHQDVDKVRELAQQAIHQSVDEAVLLIKLAHSLRPTGPLINKLKDKFIAQQKAAQP